MHWTLKMRREQEAFAALPPSAVPTAGPARMDTLMANLVPTLPADAMVTLGAGEHTNCTSLLPDPALRLDDQRTQWLHGLLHTFRNRRVLGIPGQASGDNCR